MRVSTAALVKVLHGQLRSLWVDDASHPAARQPRPWGLNRWVLLAIYMVYATLTSSVYFGWRSMSALLVRSGQFEWVCDEESRAARDQRRAANGDSPSYLCELQDAKIQSLFTIAMACHFTCSALAGWMLDTVGPKTVALLGQVFNSLAWILLGFSGPSFRAVYPAFVFMGAGADVSVYPTLLIVSLFPRNTAIIMAVMGACISTSFFVPYVLKAFWQQVDVSFLMLCVSYVLVGPVLCILFSLLFVPHKAFKGVDAFAVCVEAERLRKDADTTESAGGTLQASGCTIATTRQHAMADGKRESAEVSTQQTETMMDSSAVGAGNGDAAAINLPEKGYLGGTDCGGPFPQQPQEQVAVFATTAGETTGRSLSENTGDDESHSSERSLICGDKGDYLLGDESVNAMDKTHAALPDVEDFGAYVEDPRFKKQKVSFFSQSMTFLYFGICMYFVVCGWAMSFFQEAAGRFLSPAVEHKLELLTPLSTLPCIVFGFLISRLGIMGVIFALNTCGIIMYVCVLCAAGSALAQNLAVVCFFFYISVFTTQMYVYIESTFDSNHFGRLIGWASLVGGLLSLLSNVLYGEVTVKLLSGDVRPVAGAILCILCLQYPMLLMMSIQKQRKNKAEQLEVNRRAKELQNVHLKGDTLV